MDLNKLLDINLEIEGLIRTLKVRESDDVRRLLLSKVEDMTSMVKLISYDDVVEESSYVESQYTPVDNTFEPKTHLTEEKAEVNVAEVVSEEISPVQHQYHDTKAPAMQQQIRVEDVIMQKESRDFSKIFSINDKYRFIRDVFNNNVNDFNSAVAKVSQMSSLNEAYDYFLNELGWEADEEAVADFLSRVANHFNAV